MQSGPKVPRKTSMVDSNISEPFVLATYHSTLRSSSNSKHFVGAYASVHHRSDEYVTVSAQADAVHILDVSDLHPIISHTLGPSTYFSCPALSISASKSSWITYAVMSSSPTLPSSEDSGRKICMWRFDSTSKETNTLSSKALSTPIHSIYLFGELKSRILALSSAGDVTMLDAENLEIRSNWPSPSNLSEPTLQYAWLLSMGPTNPQSGAFMVIIYSISSNTHLRILAIDETDSITQVNVDIELPVENILDATCNPSGCLSILTSDGRWFLYTLQPSFDSFESLLSNSSKPLRLANHSWLTHSPSISRPPVTTLSLTSCHVLLATISSHEIILQIWDLQYGVLLTSYSFPIPAAVASSSKLHLKLVADHEKLCQSSSKTEVLPNSRTSGHAYLLLSSIPGSEASGTHNESKITSVVLVVPITVPRISTVASAMGRGSISKQWLKDDHSNIADETTKNSGKKGARDLGNRNLPSLRTTLLEGEAQAGEAMYLKWTSTLKEEEEMDVFGYNFVQELLTVAFPLPSDSHQVTRVSYPTHIIHDLIGRGVVSSAMLTSRGGLLKVLKAQGDWKCIELAFNKVSDLTEMEIVETLKTVLAHHRRSLQADSTQHAENLSNSIDAMQIDNTSSRTSTNQAASVPIALGNYLRLMLSYPTTRAPLIHSFRRHLQDPEDITILLGILSDWFSERSKLSLDVESHTLLPRPKDLKKTMEGVWIVSRIEKRKAKAKQESVPPLEKITNHISMLLDSSFLSLLSYKPSHPILRTISSQIVPELAFVHAAQDVRGGLEPFAIFQERTLRESLVPKAEKEREKQKIDWRHRKKGPGAAGGGPGADVGIYTVEELVL